MARQIREAGKFQARDCTGTSCGTELEETVVVFWVAAYTGSWDCLEAKELETWDAGTESIQGYFTNV